MSSFKIGTLLESFHLPFAEAVDKAKELGVDGIQVYAGEGEITPEKLSQEDRRALVKRLAEKGLAISALCGDLGGHGFQIASENVEKIRRSKAIVDLAVDLGTRIITTHIGVIPKDKSSETYQTMLAACRELGAYAESRGCIFAVETGPEPACVLAEFLKEVASAGIGVNLDPANLVMVTNDDPVKAVGTLAEFIVHTHAKDGVHLKDCDPVAVYNAFAGEGIDGFDFGTYFNETPLGTGSVDWPAYLAALKSIGYRGYLTIERECGENPARDIAIAVDFLRKNIAF